jgi:NDP-sugar pyrophosphorylase family protein
LTDAPRPRLPYYVFHIPFGAVEIEVHKNLEIKEKTEQHFFVNAGIYVFEINLLALIPKGAHCDIDRFSAKNNRNRGRMFGAFPVREYWLYIGRVDDYNKGDRKLSSEFMN